MASDPKDKPGEHRLRNKTEHEIHLLAVEVVIPASDAAVLQPLVESKTEEQDGFGNDDSVDETWDGLQTDYVDDDRSPGDRPATVPNQNAIIDVDDRPGGLLRS